MLFPSEARAEWITISGTNYGYIADSVPTSFKVTPIYQANTACTNLISNGTIYSYGWNTDATETNPYLIRYVNIGGGQLAKDNRISIKAENVTFYYGSATGSNGSSAVINAQQYRYFVSKGNNSGTTEIFPNDKGVFVMPFDAQYVFVTCRLALTTAVRNATYWRFSDGIQVSIERPEDQNEVAAINDQTTQLKDTTGSDTVAGDAVTDAQQQVNNIPLVNILDTFTTGVQQQVNIQDVDGSVTFPGMTLAGFTVPQATIRPMSLVSEDMQTIIRSLVTFVFVQAFLRHIFHLIDVIFVIQDFGTLDVGMDSIDRGPKVRSWSSDYDIDEDLGF